MVVLEIVELLGGKVIELLITRGGGAKDLLLEDVLLKLIELEPG